MAIAFIQYDDFHDAVTGTTVATDAALSVTAGNFIVVVIGAWDGTLNAAIVTGIADTAGNSYTKAIGVYRTTGTSERVEIWYAENISGHAANIVTATFTGDVDEKYISAAEFSGVATSSSLDDTASTANVNTTNHTSGNATASAAGTLIIGGITNVNTKNITVGTNFTSLTSDLTGVYFLAEYLVLGAADDYAAICTTNTTNSSIMGAAIFLSAAPPVGNAGMMTPNTGFWGPTF